MADTDTPQGFVQIYTGNGKGKSTAAYGLALRAAGAGKKTLLIQLMKATYPYSELNVFARLTEWITVKRYGSDEFVLEQRPATDREIEPGREALQRVVRAFEERSHDLVILDEVCVAVHFGLLEADDLLPIFAARPGGVELVLTGRYCPDEWLEYADLVTEMREVKHYYTRGVLSRPGFDS